MLVLLSESQKIPDGSSDFYTEPNVAEARKCIPILENLQKRVEELLVQWPEHVTLLQVMFFSFN